MTEARACKRCDATYDKRRKGPVVGILCARCAKEVSKEQACMDFGVRTLMTRGTDQRGRAALPPPKDATPAWREENDPDA